LVKSFPGGAGGGAPSLSGCFPAIAALVRLYDFFGTIQTPVSRTLIRRGDLLNKPIQNRPECSVSLDFPSVRAASPPHLPQLAGPCSA
jgi:hypothetical protein